MIIKNPEKHLTDQEFYTYIKFFDLVIEKKNLDDDDSSFKVSDLGIGNDEAGYIFNRVFMSSQVLEISVDIEQGYEFNEEFVSAKKKAEEKPEKEKKELLKILNDIKTKKKIKIENIGKISWIWYEVYKYVLFTPSEYKCPKKIENIFRTEINKYLDNFINDKLAIVKKNYYKFKAQKRTLIELIEEDEKINLYGNNFIIKEQINQHCVLKRIPDFCIVQTVYALQKLDYLKVGNAWEEKKYKNNMSFSEKDIIRYVNVNIVLEDIFIKEINNKYKKDNPKNIFEKFDSKRGVLNFAGQEIELAKKGKKTDAVLLMTTLLKADSDEWKHNDEILMDWGYNYDDQQKTPKNKVYFAGQKINNAVALKTQIEDFIECNTTKARINPKYQKIDE